MTAGYLARRLAQLLPTVAGIVLVGFVLTRLAPGDPVLALAGQHGDAEYYAFMRERFGLDRSIPAQLWTYVSNVARGDFGVSYTHSRPAMDVVLERVPATLILSALALALSSVVGIALGVVAAIKPGGVRDLGISLTSLGFYSAPVFFVAQAALLLFVLVLGWFPSHGMRGAAGVEGLWAQAGDLARHLVLPVAVLASQEIAAVARLTRSELGDELHADYVRTAHAKGVRRGRVVTRHALRLALLPVVTVIGARVGHLISGAVIVEVVFGWPGLGQLMLGAMQTRNSPVLLAIFVLVAISVVVANLVTDLSYAALDPRIRFD